MSARHAVVFAAIAVMALVAAVLWGRTRSGAEQSYDRPVVVPATLGGMSISTAANWRQAHQQIVSGFTNKHPGHAFGQAYYGEGRGFSSLMAYRGPAQDVPDLALFDRLPMTKEIRGDATCGRRSVLAECYRTEGDLTLVVTLMATGDEGRAASLLDEAWAAQRD